MHDKREAERREWKADFTRGTALVTSSMLRYPRSSDIPRKRDERNSRKTKNLKKFRNAYEMRDNGLPPAFVRYVRSRWRRTRRLSNRRNSIERVCGLHGRLI